jgi:trk system potassium uptake protein TrkA
MLVIIVGAGKIGFNLAKILAREDYDVVLIEKEKAAVENLEEYLDIQVLIGDGVKRSVLEKAGVQAADLFIAVTASDEVNLVACMVAKTYGSIKTVARVRNPEYAYLSRRKKETFPGVDYFINPELILAKEIIKLIDVPEALDVVYYAEGKIQLLELKITAEAPIVKRQIKDLKASNVFLIAAIVRDEQVIIPRGEDFIYPDDTIFVLAKTKEMIAVEHFLGTKRTQVEHIMIFGGNYTAYHLASILEKRGYQVKIIEPDYQKGVELSQQLQTAMVLHGNPTDLNFLANEGIDNIDVFVSLATDDQLNLLVSLIVKDLGVRRTVARVGRTDYLALLEKVGLDIGISPWVLIANRILRFIRHEHDLLSITLLGNEHAEMAELLVTENSPVAYRQLKVLDFPRGSLVGSIYREREVIIPRGDDFLKPGDHITLFALPDVAAKAIKYITG